jgi:CheY-like chemotaxis protein
MNIKKSLTVLVVEDVAEISAQMLAIIRQKRYGVSLATNANEALQMAERDRPLMILTDTELPTFDSLLRRLRRHVKLKGLTVAVIDINGPKISGNYGVKVLPDFDQLDKLLKSLPRPKLI